MRRKIVALWVSTLLILGSLVIIVNLPTVSGANLIIGDNVTILATGKLIVPTGATYSIYNSDFCDRLSLDVLNEKRVDIIVGDGGIIPVYLHDVKIQIEDIEFYARMGFSDRLGTGINILGRETVLDVFVVCFDGIKKEIRWEH